MSEPLHVGMNKTAFRRGSQFVKPITRGGNPHAEEAASKAMSLLGVPSIPVHTERLPSGETAAVSPFHEMNPIGFATRKYMDDHPDYFDKRRAGHLLLSDFILGALDRHSGNYAHIPGRGMHSIDHGETFHQGNLWWRAFHEGNPMDGHMSMADNPQYFAEHPNASALWEHHHYINPSLSQPAEHPSKIPMDQSMIDTALKHRDQLEQLAYEGTNGLPEQERKLAVLALRLRLNHVERKRPVNAGELADLHDDVLNEAARTFGKRGSVR